MATTYKIIISQRGSKRLAAAGGEDREEKERGLPRLKFYYDEQAVM